MDISRKTRSREIWLRAVFNATLFRSSDINVVPTEDGILFYFRAFKFTRGNVYLHKFSAARVSRFTRVSEPKREKTE